MSVRRIFLDELTTLVKKAADPIQFADKTRYGDLPSAANAEWTFNVQRHLADKAGPHLDLRLHPPGSSDVYSWALPKGKLPEIGERRLAVRQPAHVPEYLGYSGDIQEGYGKGKVNSELLGPVKVLESTKGKVRFSSGDKTYLLHRTQDDKNWHIRRV